MIFSVFIRRFWPLNEFFEMDKIIWVSHARLPGIQLDEILSWNKHFENIAKKATSGIGEKRIAKHP